MENKYEIWFRLLKPIGIYKVGHLFDCFGGLVSGVNGISFTDEDYFKIVKRKV